MGLICKSKLIFSHIDDEDMVNGVHGVHPECSALPQCVEKLFLSTVYGYVWVCMCCRVLKLCSQFTAATVKKKQICCKNLQYVPL